MIGGSWFLYCKRVEVVRYEFPSHTCHCPSFLSRPSCSTAIKGQDQGDSKTRSEKVASVLKTGKVDVNAVNMGSSLLHWGKFFVVSFRVSFENGEHLRLSLSLSVSLPSSPPLHLTPNCHSLAAWHRQPYVVEILLKHGVNIWLFLVSSFKVTLDPPPFTHRTSLTLSLPLLSFISPAF